MVNLFLFVSNIKFIDHSFISEVYNWPRIIDYKGNFVFVGPRTQLFRSAFRLDNKFKLKNKITPALSQKKIECCVLLLGQTIY